MKIKYLLAGAVAAIALHAHAEVDVGVSIGISQPGVYGRIDIGRFPQPQVIATYPAVVMPRPHVVVQPVYMWVPPGHRKDWRRHCGGYGACGVPVAFVHDDWYHSHVAPPGHSHSHKDKGNKRKGPKH